MRYKNIYGTAEYSEEDELWHGRLVGVKDLITYESDTEEGLAGAFISAIDRLKKVDELIAMADDMLASLKGMRDE